MRKKSRSYEPQIERRLIEFNYESTYSEILLLVFWLWCIVIIGFIAVYSKGFRDRFGLKWYLNSRR